MFTLKPKDQLERLEWETQENFVAWLKKQKPVLPIKHETYDKCALGLYYKENGKALDVKMSALYSDLCESKLMYDINQNKTYGKVQSMLKEKGL